jgi:hypothetical protein
MELLSYVTVKLCRCMGFTLDNGNISLETCGSNYDDFGNNRFVDDRFTSSDGFISKLDYGTTLFDNMYGAFLAILEGVTASGWSDILTFVSVRRALCLGVVLVSAR